MTAAAVPNSLPSLTEKDRIAYINRKIIDKMQLVFSIITHWGGEIERNQTFEEFLRKNKNFNDSKFKRIFRNDLKRLNQSSFVGLDIPLMCQILPLLCREFSEPGKAEWKKRIKDQSTMEYQLTQMREMRNAVMHEPENAAVDPNLSTHLEKTVSALFDIAGAKYGKGPDEISQAKDEVKELISSIKNTVLTERENGLLQYMKLIDMEGIPELRDRVKTSKERNFRYMSDAKGFYRFQLAIKDGLNSSISCREILGYCSRENLRVLFIEGQNGTGKSTLIRKLQSDLLLIEGHTKLFEGSEEFKVPLLFNCRTLSCRTVVDLIRNAFPSSAAKIEDKELIDVTFLSMKCIFLVDDLDKINDCSKDLAESVLEFLERNNKSMCIFTARPNSANVWEDKLQKKGLSLGVVQLMEIKSKEEQMDFLKLSCEKGTEISLAYEKTSLNLKLPVLLSLFGHFFLSDSNSVMSWTSPVQIMQRITVRGLRTAQQILFAEKVDDCDGICESVLERIAFLSFCCLLKGKTMLGRSETVYLIEQIREKCAIDDRTREDGQVFKIDPTLVLSCFFPAIDSCSEANDISFFHATHQELLAARYVAQRMLRARSDINAIIANALSEYQSIIEGGSGKTKDGKKEADKKNVEESKFQEMNLGKQKNHLSIREVEKVRRKKTHKPKEVLEEIEVEKFLARLV